MSKPKGGCATPATPQARGRLGPTFAASDAQAHKRARQMLRHFRAAYREAFEMFRRGAACVFPAGTYWLARVAAVCCAPLDTARPVLDCAAVDDTYCNSCDKCGEGEICEPNVGCEPEPQLGDPCEHDFECTTGNCSALSGVCRVPIGAPCDATNCDDCFVTGDFSFCSADCEIDRDFIMEGNGVVCIDRYDDGSSNYFRTCAGVDDRSCPLPCLEYIDVDSFDDAYFCACDTCTHHEYQRPLGERCTSSTHCATGACTRFGREDDGLCTQECASDGECPEPARCAGGLCLVPCMTGNTVAGDCPAGHCFGFDLAGETVLLCDAHISNGGACVNESWCTSGSCIGSVCRGSAVLGGACRFDGDCLEGRCCNGTCHSAC